MYVNCCLAQTIGLTWDTTAIIPLPQAYHSGEHGKRHYQYTLLLIFLRVALQSIFKVISIDILAMSRYVQKTGDTYRIELIHVGRCV